MVKGEERKKNFAQQNFSGASLDQKRPECIMPAVGVRMWALETPMRDKILLIIILTLLAIAQTYEYIELKELEARTIQTHN